MGTLSSALLVVGGVLIIIAVWWQVSAKHWFKGPVRTVETVGDPAEAP